MHISVLLDEVLSVFESCHLEYFMDGTLGLGGHARALLSKHPEIVKYLGVDRDHEAQSKAKEQLKEFQGQLCCFHGNYGEYEKALKKFNIKELDGILLDLGVSSLQLDTPERGFSFRFDGPLDMRMDRTKGKTAADILNTWSQEDIADILYHYGELRNSRAWARNICQARDAQPFKMIQDLLNVRAPGPHNKKHHPFTLVFQALRIAVNDELAPLHTIIQGMFDRLKPKGRLAIISFHSLEDRIVKSVFRELSQKRSELLGTGEVLAIKPKGTLIHRRGLAPSDEEIAENARSRSARLRVIEKI